MINAQGNKKTRAELNKYIALANGYGGMRSPSRTWYLN